MSTYVDASVIVAALTNEDRTADAIRWLSGQPAGELLISDWTITEVSSALSLKLRTGAVTGAERAAALAEFRRLIAEAFDVAAFINSRPRPHLQSPL